MTARSRYHLHWAAQLEFTQSSCVVNNVCVPAEAAFKQASQQASEPPSGAPPSSGKHAWVHW
jgi:hypothetical protein